MKHWMLLLWAIVPQAGIWAQEETGGALVSLETMQGQYRAMLEIVVEPLDDQKKRLFEQYAAAVERMQANFESRGESENAALAAAEAELARTQFQCGESDFPGIAAARAKLNEEAAKIENGKLPKMIAIRNQYVTRLKKLRAALLAAGDSAGVREVTREMKRLAATKLEVPTPIAVRDEREIKLEVIRNSILHGSSRKAGEFTLEPGRYVLEEQAHIGDRDIEGNAGEGHVILPGPSEVEGRIFVDRGSFKVTQTLFKKANLQANLSGKWEAAGCLFDGCLLDKAGGWYTRYYSSKWIFDDCVFAEAFMRRLDYTPVGVQATNCTILDAEIPPARFYEDAGKEARSDWRKVENCHFIRCEVPESFLLITENCLFEDCVFREDEDPIPIQTPLSTTIYAKPVDRPKIAGSQWEISVQPAEAISSQPGSSMPYVYRRGQLRFR